MQIPFYSRKGYLMTTTAAAQDQALTILHIDSSSLSTDSQTRKLTRYLVEQITAHHPGTRVTARDVARGLPLIDETWVDANFTPDEDRSPAQRDALALSDHLVQELFDHDVIVIGAPVYNFSIPASLKAWLDLVARARKTFQYTAQGPEGLLVGKKAYLVVASGGTAVGSDMDFATPYLTHILGFMGITDVTVIAADVLMADAAEKITTARANIEHYGKAARAAA